MARLTDEDRAEIIALFQAGESQHAIAKRLGCSVSSVNRTIKALGLERSAPKTEQRSTAAATEAHVAYSRERRLALVDAGLAKAEQLLEALASSKELRDWSVGLGVLIDKRRLEDESTEVAGGEILALMDQMRADVRTAERETSALNPDE